MAIRRQKANAARAGATLLAVLVAGGMAWSSAASAQVGPTEVNEEAVDEFGLERKTGRFTWSSHEIIEVGGDDTGFSLVVTGIRNPAWADTTWPQRIFPVNTNQPRLVSFPMPDRNSPIPGAIDLNHFERTVSFVGGSESFKCSPIHCASEYFTGSSLDVIPDGLLYTNTQGVEVYFEEYQSRIVHPDGREIVFEPSKSRRTNFGYMLQFAGGEIQAVNLAVDYCSGDGQSLCTTSVPQRLARISAPSTGTIVITDAAGEDTLLRWGSITAKHYRRPQGADPSLQIRDITEKYPLGITLPGSSVEDITITYNQIDPTLDTHDDIWATSIVRAGITANYAFTRIFPHGQSEALPRIQRSETLDSVMDQQGVGLQSQLSLECVYTTTDDRNYTTQGPPPENGGSGGGGFSFYNPTACDELAEMEALQAIVDQIAASQNVQQLPLQLREIEEPGSLGSEVYTLAIDASVEGQLVSQSLAKRPAGFFGSKRRRLLHVDDGLGRRTEYLHNQFEEVGGMIFPEGNTIQTEYDGRGNIIRTVATDKSGAEQLESAYTYAPSCTAATRATCNKPLTATDPEGNVTQYEYNDRGQVVTETGPAPIPGGVRPQIRNSYTLRTAYIKGPNGGVVAAGPPVSLLTRSSMCLTLVSCEATADEVITDYDYGPTTGLNNLLLRGVGVTAANEQGQIETRWTCYQYNYFGEKIAETQPNANLASCP